MSDIFALREQYRSEDAANRVVEKNYTLEDELPEDLFALMVTAYNHCKCGNILTIEDYAGTCHQCRIWPYHDGKGTTV